MLLGQVYYYYELIRHLMLLNSIAYALDLDFESDQVPAEAAARAGSGAVEALDEAEHGVRPLECVCIKVYIRM